MIRLPLSIDALHPAFEGHFPSNPIVPGAVLLDHGLRAIAVHRGRTTPRAASEQCRLGAVKFLSFVRPGESLRLEMEASTVAPASFVMRIFVGPVDDERLALSGAIAFASVSPPAAVAADT